MPFSSSALTSPASVYLEGGCVKIPDRPGLGIDIDMESVEKANRLYEKQGKGARNDAMAMQYLMPGWKYDPKRPAFLFKE